MNKIIVFLCLMLPSFTWSQVIIGHPCHISGRIVDDNGLPLDHVELNIEVWRIENLAEVCRFKTNIFVDGSFEFSHPEAVSINISSKKEGYADGDIHVRSRDLMADDILIRMTKAPPPVALIFVDGVNLRHRYSESFYGMKSNSRSSKNE